MTEADVIRAILEHLEPQFPRTCKCCQRCFVDLRQYVADTQYVGDPVCADLDDGDLEPTNPLGTFALANCPCGTTLSVNSHGMRITTLWQVMRWGHAETVRRNVTPTQVLADFRIKLRATVLAAPSRS